MSFRATLPHEQSNTPLAYLITFSCYGTRLHGDHPESVDRRHNVPQAPFLAVAPAVVFLEEGEMRQTPYRLDRGRRSMIWARHGSTRYLWKTKDVAAAIEYVVWGQGEAMEVWRREGATD